MALDKYPNNTYHNKNIVLFVGGVGGAKLAYGLYQTVPHDNLTIIVNTGDDVWHYGLRISPDVDTLLYTLSGRVDPHNGWGLSGDTTTTLDTLQRLGEKPWFRLGDKDIATHLVRTGMLREGRRLTHVVDKLRKVQGILCRVLPMADEEIPTIISTHEHGELGFQEYFVRYRWQPKLISLRYQGADVAQLTPEIAQAVDESDMIIFGPSNPWLSLGPILAIPALKRKLQLLNRRIPIVAVTPIIAGNALKGPAAKIMRELGHVVNPNVIVDFYRGTINAFISDIQDPPLVYDDVRTTSMNTVMMTDADKVTFAQMVLEWLVALEK